MDKELEKIDLIRSRTGVTYREAKEALDEAEGSVLDALIIIEEKVLEGKNGTWTERVQVTGQEVWQKIRDLVHEGNVTKVVIKQEGNVVAEIPLTAGAVGTVLAPTLAAIGVGAAILTGCTLEIERSGPKI